MTYVHIDSSGRIQSSVKKKEYSEPDSFEFDFPEDFDFSLQNEYRIVDGELVHDPLPPTEEELKMEENRKRNEQLEIAIPMMLQVAAQNFTDEQIVSIALVFDEWSPGQKHKTGEFVRVGETVYRVIANVNKNNLAEPGTEEGSAYYKPISVTPEGVENWTQPVDKKNAYSKGDRVFHNDVVWESTANNNMDEPGTSDTWKEVDN